MRKLIVSLLLVGALGACTDPDGARRHLKALGFTDIKTGGYGFLTCGQGDRWATRFKATSPSGDRVSGVVCAGLFKGATVRFN